MSVLNNPLEIFKLLPKTNCRQCQVPTCLSFAAAVIKGERRLGDCPSLDSSTIEHFEGRIEKRATREQQLEQALDQLKKEIGTVDFSSSAPRLGALFSNGKLIVRCLGRNYTVDANGNITSECHTNSWVTFPLLAYVIYCSGHSFLGKWVPFRNLKNGLTFSPLYEQRCEKPLKKIADSDVDLFENILHILGGRPAEEDFSSDISLILYPLPKVPILICYKEQDDDLESQLNIFYDLSTEKNLNIESVYMLMAGITGMLEKMAVRHGGGEHRKSH
ncbi:MAG: DUF3786 domain-containing protein [Bacillota bacterium]